MYGNGKVDQILNFSWSKAEQRYNPSDAVNLENFPDLHYLEKAALCNFVV